MDNKRNKRRVRVHLDIKLDLVMVLMIILFLLLVGVYLWHSSAANGGLKDAISAESDSLRTHVSECAARVESKVDSRAEEIERRIDQLDAKLDSIDAKIDKLTRLISPPLPDGLKRVD